jgi:hypothetical protein
MMLGRSSRTADVQRLGRRAWKGAAISVKTESREPDCNTTHQRTVYSLCLRPPML